MLRVRRADGSIDDLGEIDVVLPILHGVHGEDGTIQGFFDTLEHPVRGRRSARLRAVHGQALHEDRAAGRGRAGITVGDGHTGALGPRSRGSAGGCRPARRAGVRQARARRVERRRLEGARRRQSSQAALELAFAEDDKVLIEQAISGREVEVAILEGRGGAGPAGIPPG